MTINHVETIQYDYNKNRAIFHHEDGKAVTFSLNLWNTNRHWTIENLSYHSQFKVTLVADNAFIRPAK
jgi:hypothetical protein